MGCYYISTFGSRIGAAGNESVSCVAFWELSLPIIPVLLYIFWLS